MKRIILKFGLYSTAILIGLNLLSLSILGTDPSNFGVGEIFGYAAIIISMVFVFLGIREHVRESEKSRFTDALKVGSLISLIPSLIFGIYNIIYVKWIDPEFYDHYNEYLIGKMENPGPEAIAAIQAEMDPISNPFAMFILMFFTVFLIGFAVSIISGIILRK